MFARTANLLGTLSLAIADRIDHAAREVLRHGGETAAALVVIGYGFGPSNEGLRKILGLSHPGAVRLVDRLVADGLVERRRKEGDRRTLAFHLTAQGHVAREAVLTGRLAAIEPLIASLSDDEIAALGALLAKILRGLDPTDLERRTLCRLCDDRVCTNCPIPASFRRPDGSVGQSEPA